MDGRSRIWCGAAQALAVYESKPLSMAHIKRVIDVAESFERDLKGGTGYSDAMRSKFLMKLTIVGMVLICSQATRNPP